MKLRSSKVWLALFVGANLGLVAVAPAEAATCTAPSNTLQRQTISVQEHTVSRLEEDVVRRPGGTFKVEITVVLDGHIEADADFVADVCVQSVSTPGMASVLVSRVWRADFTASAQGSRRWTAVSAARRAANESAEKAWKDALWQVPFELAHQGYPAAWRASALQAPGPAGPAPVF